MVDLERYALAPEQLRRQCDPAQFTFRSTAELPPLTEIIGQDRATRALEFGMDIPSEGFDIYAVGPSGVGKTSTVRQFLTQKAAKEPVPDDWCYVNNFAEPRSPKALRLPAGKASQLRNDMSEFVRQARVEIPRAFESEYYSQREGELTRGLQEQQNAELANLDSYVRERSFALLKTPMGLVIAPVLNEEVLNPEQYEQLPPEIKQRFESRRPELQEALEKATRRAREVEKATREKIKALETEVAEFALGHLIEELNQKYGDDTKVREYIAAVHRDVLENVQRFRETEAKPSPLPLAVSRDESTWFNRYAVNVIVDHSASTGAPVIIESNPTYYNLVGSFEHQALFGAWITDFTLIKPGALHKANGGYLVVDARRLLSAPYAWDALKRALRTNCVRVEEAGQELRVLVSTSLEPEPIPLRIKVVIIGDPQLYYLLYALDDEFSKLFKVKADFDYEIPWSDENQQKYALFIAARCRAEGLLHFDPTGVAEVVEQGARLVDDQRKLAVRFAEIADLVREASFWAKRQGHELVTADDVRKAIAEHTYRANRIEERIREMIADGTIEVATEGEMIGQVNGLAVINIGDYQFGRPIRITAKTYWGRTGVVNVDREVKMTEAIHDKGVMISIGYLSSRFAKDKPLALTASIVFEQGYEGIAGDSASSTELYALLSSIAELPIKQGIAVTGSVDQHGEIQPVGGVTHKIEGFFDVCRLKGLTGEQGVIIPRRSVSNLMLRQDVVDAVREKRFHIYAVDTIDEGISILTGVEAGVPDTAGNYPEGSVNWRVNQRLCQMAAQLQAFERAKSEAEEKPAPASEESPPPQQQAT